MKVTKVTKGNISVKGITFKPNVEVEVEDTIGKYLKDVFTNDFSFKEVKKPVRKAPKKVVKDDK